MGLRLGATLVLFALLAAPGAATFDPARTFLMTAFQSVGGGHRTPRRWSASFRGRSTSRTVARWRRSASSASRRRPRSTSSVWRTSPRSSVPDDVLQIGTFSTPPQLRDVASLIIDEADLKRLRECRVEDCDVRLSADGIERVRRDIDWRAADASRNASRAGAAAARRLCRPLSPERNGGGDGVRGSRAATECRP